jgi:hypothetical protein
MSPPNGDSQTEVPRHRGKPDAARWTVRKPSSKRMPARKCFGTDEKAASESCSVGDSGIQDASTLRTRPNPRLAQGRGSKGKPEPKRSDAEEMAIPEGCQTADADPDMLRRGRRRGRREASDRVVLSPGKRPILRVPAQRKRPTPTDVHDGYARPGLLPRYG